MEKFEKKGVKARCFYDALGPVLAGFIFEENANVNMVSVPRSCHKLLSGTKKTMSQKRTVCHMRHRVWKL